jgi:flagellin
LALGTAVWPSVCFDTLEQNAPGRKTQPDIQNKELPMSNSINTNTGSIIALQNLNITASELQTTQNRISTGLSVSSAKDNGAIWGIAQNSRSTVSSLDAVKQSLQRAQSTVDVAVSAGQTVSDLLNQIKSKTLAASDTSLDATSRTALNSDVTALVNQITRTVANADFNGTNIVKSGGTAITALANATGGATNVLTVAAQDLSVGGANLASLASPAFTTATLAGTYLGFVNTAITNTNAAVSKLGTASNALTTHLNFVSNLADTLTQGIGNLVDADVAKESANLTALQTKQQLGVQALSIANSSKSGLLSLFR